MHCEKNNAIFIANDQYFMIQNKRPSQRQLLIARAKRYELTSRIKNNLQEIQQKTEKLSQSRTSSLSSKSQKTQKSYLSAEVRQKSPKVRLLENIVEKLTSQKIYISKKSEIPTQDHLLRSENVHVVHKKYPIAKKEETVAENIVQASPSRHKSKLQMMLKDIKRCNQQSTKAVSSVKKGVLIGCQIILQKHQPSPIKQPTNITKKPGQSLVEIIALKQELRKAKQQNKLLLQIIQINEYTNSKDRAKDKKCQMCGCTCKDKLSNKLMPKQVSSQRKMKRQL